MDDNKKGESPSGTKKKNVTVRRSKSESKSKAKSTNDGAESTPPPFSRNPTMRNLFSNFGNNRKKNTTNNKKDNDNNGGAGPSSTTQIDANLLKPSTNELDTSPIKGGIISTDKDADEYNMRHKKRGKAIIFNQENFDKEDRRNGTQIDVDKLVEVLSKLKFEVDIHKDLEYVDILTLLKQLQAADYTESDCIMFFILTHGNKRREISAKDVYYSVEKLWEKFTSDNCPSLAGKPKLFFVNACRGKKKDAGIRLFRGRTEADSSQKMQSYKIPNHADFLIAYSTVEGYYSYRESHYGSWFIQCFCQVLDQYYKTKDLLKILTITTRKVALDYKTQSDRKEDCELQQVPSITSMLLRDIYFHDD